MCRGHLQLQHLEPDIDDFGQNSRNLAVAYSVKHVNGLKQKTCILSSHPRVRGISGTFRHGGCKGPGLTPALSGFHSTTMCIKAWRNPKQRCLLRICKREQDVLIGAFCGVVSVKEEGAAHSWRGAGKWMSCFSACQITGKQMAVCKTRASAELEAY